MVEVRFVVDIDTYISLTCNEVDEINQLIMCSQSKIDLWYKNTAMYLLQNTTCSNSLWDAVLRMQDSLEAVLKAELQPPLHWPSVGYMLNEYFEDSIKYNSEEQHNPVYYLMLSVVQSPATLLYNKNGEIVLQIVPIFDSSINKIPYRIFIRNYRSYFTRTIARETAQDWLDQIVKLRQIMLNNYDRDKANMVEEVWSPNSNKYE